MPRPGPRLTKSLIAAWVAACAAIVVGAAATFEYRFIDLAVYRWGGEAAMDAPNLYAAGHPVLGLPFTYTPFAALCFGVLDALRLLEPVAWTAVSLAALARLSWLLARERGAWLAGMATVWPALVIFATIAASQPGTSTIRLGQVGFVLPWLVAEDLLGRRRRWSGVLTGLATAIKLTPGAFIVLWAVVGRWRAALAASATFAATVAIGWIALPTESRTYWRHLGPGVDTVGDVTTEEHWSINATVWRIAGDGGNDIVWLACALAAFAGCMALARRWWLGGEPGGAVGLVGLGSVLASPFSWSHHWVVVAPLLVALVGGAHRSGRPTLVRWVIAGCVALVMTGVWWHAPRLVLEPLLGAGDGAAVAANGFLVVAAALLVLAWQLRPVIDERDVSRAPSATRPAGRPRSGAR